MIDETNIREVHGVVGFDSLITAVERKERVMIAIKYTELDLSPDDALRLASMLRWLASRIKARAPK